MNDVEEIRIQHFLNYKNAVIEIINNNTEVLYEEDIKSLFKVPPLDSMDLLKTKIIFLAKKENNIIDNEKLKEILDDYRDDIYVLLDKFKNDRKNMLIDLINKNTLDNMEIIKLNKKDFNEFDKKIKKELKEGIITSFNKNIKNNVHLLFTKEKMEIIEFDDQLDKYFKKIYLKQIIDNYDFKILVKNTILINGIKEQGERYNFTLENSRIFNE